MDHDDKLYLWLVIITFLAFAGAIGVVWAEWDELKDPAIVSSPPFAS